jgi:single-strand DNA-binding protein
MSSINSITIVGNLGSDPELRSMPDGSSVANFTIATNEKVKGEDKTTWFRVSVFGKQADAVAKFLTKGSKAFVIGSLRLDTYDRRDGNGQGTSLEVRAQTVQFLDSKPQASAAGAGAETASPAPEGDVPF